MRKQRFFYISPHTSIICVDELLPCLMAGSGKVEAEIEQWGVSDDTGDNGFLEGGSGVNIAGWDTWSNNEDDGTIK
jgi:hypothetical protein